MCFNYGQSGLLSSISQGHFATFLKIILDSQPARTDDAFQMTGETSSRTSSLPGTEEHLWDNHDQENREVPQIFEFIS